MRESPRHSCADFAPSISGLLMNCLILGWVTKAMTSIVGIVAGQERRQSAGHLHFLPDSVHGNLRLAGRTVGRVVDRSVSICFEDGHRDRGRVVRCACRRRDAAIAGETGGHARGSGSRRESTSLRCFRIFRADSRAKRYGRCRCSRFSCTWACSGGRSGIRERSRAAAATSRSEFSARAMNATDCFPCCGSTLRTTRCGRGPGF